MPCAVEFARFAEGVQLLGRAFDTAALFTDQVQLAAGQARGQGIEHVVGQVFGFGQEHHRCLERLLRRVHTKMAALGKACVQRRLITGMPAPAMGVGQFAQQIIGG